MTAFAYFGKMGIFSKKSIAGMNSLYICDLSGAYNIGYI